jgi:hypothetical protein
MKIENQYLKESGKETLEVKVKNRTPLKPEEIAELERRYGQSNLTTEGRVRGKYILYDVNRMNVPTSRKFVDTSDLTTQEKNSLMKKISRAYSREYSKIKRGGEKSNPLSSPPQKVRIKKEVYTDPIRKPFINPISLNNLPLEKFILTANRIMRREILVLPVNSKYMEEEMSRKQPLGETTNNVKINLEKK